MGIFSSFKNIKPAVEMIQSYQGDKSSKNEDYVKTFNHFHIVNIKN